MASTEEFVREMTVCDTDADDWMRNAACRGLSHLFFPAPSDRPGHPH